MTKHELSCSYILGIVCCMKAYINKIIYSQKRVSNNHRQFASPEKKGWRLALEIYTDLHTSNSRKKGNENPSLHSFSDETGINYWAVTLLLLHLE